MGFGGIDFNPEPQGGDPLAGLYRGIDVGLGFQRAQIAADQNARQQQELEMQKAAAQAQAQLAKEKAEMERGQRGLEELNKFQQYLSPETKTKLLRETIVPLANKTYGLDIDPSAVEYDDKYKNILKLMNEGASKELIKAEYGLLLSSADKESLPIIKEIGEAAGVGPAHTGIPRQTGRVTRDGLPVFFDPAIRSYAYADPATGESVPYREQTFAPSGNPSSGSEAKLAEIFQQRSIVDEALGMLSPEFVGPLDRAYKNVGAYMDNSTDPQALQFKSLSEMANTVIRNGYYGATLTNNEKKAFEDIALTRSLSPSAFAAKARGLQTSFNKMEGGIRRAAEAANRPFRDTPKESSSGGSDNDPLGLFK